jgi:histidyl-tRNA synthetase
MKYQSQRGTHDILPGVRTKDREYEVARWIDAESVFREVCRLYGYGEVRTPMFEDYDLFVRSSGETSDIVSKEMYDFFDKGDRHIALKPEGTAPVMRAYLEHQLGQQGATTRLAYQTHAFRYGRPGKGRVRQLHQFGFELIGSSSAGADFEIIQVTLEFFRRLGLTDLKLMVNSIGRAETRRRYAEVVLRHVEGWMKDKDEAVRAQAEKNPLRLLDTKDPALKAVIADIEPLATYLEDESRRHFAELIALLDEAGILHYVDHSVVRGLDYYTDTVFEVTGPDLGDDLSLCGGGRYDGLIQELGGPATPSVGVGIGIERLLTVMVMRGKEPNFPAPAAFFIAASDDARPEVRALVNHLRAEGIAVMADIDGKPVKQQFKQADRSGAPVAVIVGGESDPTLFGLKDLRTTEQTTVQRDELLSRLRQR